MDLQTPYKIPTYNFNNQSQCKMQCFQNNLRDVTTGATSATAVSDILTLSQPRGEDYAHHHRGRI